MSLGLFLGILIKPFYLAILGVLVLWPVKRRIMKMRDGKIKRLLLLKVGDSQPLDATGKER
jgi:predicted PurR-regulated permease PerM